LGKKNNGGRYVPILIVAKENNELLQVPLTDVTDSPDGKLKISPKSSQIYLKEAYQKWATFTKSDKEKEEKRSLESEKLKKNVQDLTKKCNTKQELLEERMEELQKLSLRRITMS
jgi:hypothetical protein